MNKRIFVLAVVLMCCSFAGAAETQVLPQSAVKKLWVTANLDRINLLIPWDGKYRAPARVIAPGETRQVWLDIDATKLAAGRYSTWVIVRANRQIEEGEPGDVDDFMTALGPGPKEQQNFLRKLAGEAEQRNQWWHWVDNLKYRKKPIADGEHASGFVASVERVLNRKPDKLPEVVVWTPNRWIDYPPNVMPPTLQSGGALHTSLARGEREGVCITITNVSPVKQKINVTLSPEKPDPVGNTHRAAAIKLDVEIWPITLPDVARFDIFTYNYANTDKRHLKLLKDMKCNWFSLQNPDFVVTDNRLVCDFTKTDKSLAAVKPFGKGLFIWAAVLDFTKKIKKNHGIDRTDPHFMPQLQQYLTQWVRHMRQSGWSTRDYAIQLWDEPGQKGHHDQPWKLALIAEAADMLRSAEPDVQVMLNPMMWYDGQWLDTLAESSTILSPYGGLVYLKEHMASKTWDGVKDLDHSKFRLNNQKAQVYYRKLRSEHGLKLWTYFQKNATVQNSIVYFRHFAWKNKWMDFDGVSFWSSWYVTGGAMKDPLYLGVRNWQAVATKGMYGWRDGVEDIQYLELLEDRIATMRETAPARAEQLETIRHNAMKRVADTGWWARTPQLLDEAIRGSRAKLVEALID